MKRGVAVGLVLASVALVGVLSAQYVIVPGGKAYQAGLPPFPIQAWPPHPSNIVNLMSCQDPSADPNCSTPPIAPGDYHVVFQVPADRYFVLTRAEHSSTLRLEERWQGAATVKRLNPASFSDFAEMVVGYVFRPGSEVVLRNWYAQSPVTTQYDFVGYLVDA